MHIFYDFLLPVLEKSTLGSSHLKTPAKSQNLSRLMAVVQNLTVNSMTPLQISIMFAMYDVVYSCMIYIVVSFQESGSKFWQGRVNIAIYCVFKKC